MVATQVHIEPTYDDWHSGVGSHCYQEERCVLQVAIVMYGNEDSESGDADCNWKDGEHEAVLEPVREPRNKHGETKSGCPWRYTVQLCLDGRVAVILDDGRGEVSVSVGGHNQSKVHESANKNLGVFEDI